MRRILATLVSLVTGIQLIGLGATASTGELFTQSQGSELEPRLTAASSLEGHGPSDGDFSAWTKVLANGRQLKFYAKYLEPGKKVQFLVQGESGDYEQVAWKRIDDKDLNDDGSYASLQNHVYFIRTIDLLPGKNRVRILVDGELTWGTKTYSFDPDKAPPIANPPEQNPARVQISTDSGYKKGRADFLVSISGLADGQKVTSVCLELDGQPASSTQFASILVGSTGQYLDSRGCFSPEGGIVQPSQISLSLQTTSLEDGDHRLQATGAVESLLEQSSSITASASFTTDNFSLDATAPQPTLSGSFQAGQFLTVNPGFWGQGVTFSYNWFLNDVLVRGATTDRYLLTQADVGKTLRVEVVGQKSGGGSAARTVENSLPITAQISATSSQGSIPQTSATYKVVETDSVYNSTTRTYEDKEVNNYNVTITYPSVVICEQASSSLYSSCSVEANVSWAGTFDTYESFIETAKLVRVSDGTQVASSSIYLSKLLDNETDKLTFNIYSSSLKTDKSLNSFTIQISDAGYGQTLTPLGSGQVRIIQGPNISSESMRYQVTDQAVMQSQANFVYRGGTQSSPLWTLWQYAAPLSVKVMQECAILPIYIAPQSLQDGSFKDPTTQSAADATVSVFGSNGVLREKVSLFGARGDWNTMLVGNRLDIKACDLKNKKGDRETLRIQLDLRYDALNFESTYSTSLSVSMIGNLTFTTINCYRGVEGLTIYDYKPSCPSGWTQTSAEVKNGKVVMTTINCLKGADVEVVTAPEPSCPSGYSITDRKVKDGELVPWTITCTKGLSVRKITGVFPKCPSGYS